MKKKRDIFSPDKDYKSNVVWGWWLPTGRDSFLLYAEGYLEAAKRLIEPLAKGEQCNDMVAFPIFFLFRHYIELTLKACIITKRKIKEIMEGLDTQKLKCNHDLNGLLSELKSLFSPKEEFLSESIQEKIRLIGKFDTKSQRFRYPFDTDGNWLIDDQMLIGMKNTKKMIDEISFEFNGLLGELGADEDAIPLSSLSSYI